MKEVVGGISLRKYANQRHCVARFPHVKIRERSCHKNEALNVPLHNRAIRCWWSAGFLRDLPFPTPHHSSADLSSPQSPLSVLQTSLGCCLFRLGLRIRYKHNMSRRMRELRLGAHDDWREFRARTQISRQNIPSLSISQTIHICSIPGGVAPEFPHAVIVSDDAAGRRVFSGVSRLLSQIIPMLLYTRPTSSSALKTTMVVPGVVWTNRTMVSSNTDTNRTGVLAVDKIEVKHVYTEVDFAIGSQFIRHVLDDSDPIADLQGNK
ncbi:hypothetical protein PR048_029499 [Dryococelus australis]|uniref:Uncharacterized protein n=1 Tax=Dryococelus australis TaxID=614101 RepID=A0ABQ9GFV8_9NEOP|nr:hypothetical protein PR048_029499 [Dryococelus australis]